MQTWIASLAMLAACGYTPLDAVCGGQLCGHQQICAVKQDVCIDSGGCGNGVIDPGEVCDDGNIMDGDGCSTDCRSDETCENGIIDNNAKIPEKCDHGNLNGTPGDLCDLNCHLVNLLCGNGIVDQDKGEQCDPGPMDSANCNSKMAGAASCKAARCGDGYTNNAAGENCDSSGIDIAQCVGPTCKLSICGDNYINAAAGEQCESAGNDTTTCNGRNAGPAGCHLASCGDGYTNTTFTPSGGSAPEACDTPGGADTPACNGNNRGNNGPGSCRPPSCGDGYANTAIGEQCDNLGGADSTTCNGKNAGSASCHLATCGDGHVNPNAGEQCDTGGPDTSLCNGNTAGSASCRIPACGDGYLNTRFKPSGAARTEECDAGIPCADISKSCVNCNCI